MDKHDDPVYRRTKEIRTQLALGTLDVNKLSGKDFLAIENIYTMQVIEPLWLKERSGDYSGEAGWKQIMLGFALRFGMSRRDRNIEILIQEKISKEHTEKEGIDE